MACSNKPADEEWCELMMEKPNGEWVEEEIQTFAKKCI